jgi:hypothetical protein
MLDFFVDDGRWARLSRKHRLKTARAIALRQDPMPTTARRS